MNAWQSPKQVLDALKECIDARGNKGPLLASVSIMGERLLVPIVGVELEPGVDLISITLAAEAYP